MRNPSLRNGHVEARLDRALANQAFLSLWSTVFGHVATRTCCDHHPLSITCATSPWMGCSLSSVIEVEPAAITGLVTTFPLFS